MFRAHKIISQLMDSSIWRSNIVSTVTANRANRAIFSTCIHVGVIYHVTIGHNVVRLLFLISFVAYFLEKITETLERFGFCAIILTVYYKCLFFY